jgi:phosphatidate cytidylyltransferase
MLRTRVIVAAILLPVGLVIIYIGDWVFSAFVALIVGLAAWEYSQIFRGSCYQPATAIAIAGAAAFALGRAWNGFDSAPLLISLILIISMSYHMLAYERGRDQAGADFAVTFSAAIYIGWLGAYLISIRALPEGFWWLLLVLPSVWLADSGAYFIGRSFGRHKLSPRLSPKKTWEGYFGGVLVGTLGAIGLMYLWQIWAGSAFSITPLQAGLLGFLLSTITTLGDLGESMIKRQSGVKDSSNLIPGHGGVFDRIDSWLWAALIGYYFIIWVVI